MIDVINGDLISLAEAAKILPKRRGKSVHLNTIHRWTRQGIRGVILETIRIGGSVYTTANAVQAFCDRLSQPKRTSGVLMSPDRRRAYELARAQLRAEGFIK